MPSNTFQHTFSILHGSIVESRLNTKILPNDLKGTPHLHNAICTRFILSVLLNIGKLGNEYDR